MRSKKKCENVVTDVKKVNISFSCSIDGASYPMDE
jgi:hypothetical protein